MEKAVTHKTADILTQQVYQILAAYSDGKTLNCCETIRS